MSHSHTNPYHQLAHFELIIHQLSQYKQLLHQDSSLTSSSPCSTTPTETNDPSRELFSLPLHDDNGSSPDYWHVESFLSAFREDIEDKKVDSTTGNASREEKGPPDHEEIATDDSTNNQQVENSQHDDSSSPNSNQKKSTPLIIIRENRYQSPTNSVKNRKWTHFYRFLMHWMRRKGRFVKGGMHSSGNAGMETSPLLHDLMHQMASYEAVIRHGKDHSSRDDDHEFLIEKCIDRSRFQWVHYRLQLEKNRIFADGKWTDHEMKGGINQIGASETSTTNSSCRKKHYPSFEYSVEKSRGWKDIVKELSTTDSNLPDSFPDNVSPSDTLSTKILHQHNRKQNMYHLLEDANSTIPSPPPIVCRLNLHDETRTSSIEEHIQLAKQYLAKEKTKQFLTLIRKHLEGIRVATRQIAFAGPAAFNHIQQPAPEYTPSLDGNLAALLSNVTASEYVLFR